MRRQKVTLRYLARNMTTVIGLVLVWRGIWYVLDGIDLWLLDGQRVWTAVGGVVVGLLLLYLPDHDLKEIEKL